MEITFSNYKFNEQIIEFSIENAKITGITGTGRKKMMDIINLKNVYKGKVLIDKKEISRKEINKYKQNIGIVREEFNYLLHNNIYELMYYEIRRKQLTLKNPKKKILDSLRIVGLDRSILERNINNISSSEKKLLQLAICLLSNPKVILIEEPFKCLDKNNERKIYMLFQIIKEQYNKTIVFISDDCDMLYKYTENIIIMKNDRILVDGVTRSVFERVDFLKRNRVNIPEIVEFTYLAKKKKNVKIDYHKDIRDLIKDVYKHI